MSFRLAEATPPAAKRRGYFPSPEAQRLALPMSAEGQVRIAGRDGRVAWNYGLALSRR